MSGRSVGVVFFSTPWPLLPFFFCFHALPPSAHPYKIPTTAPLNVRITRTFLQRPRQSKNSHVSLTTSTSLTKYNRFDKPGPNKTQLPLPPRRPLHPRFHGRRTRCPPHQLQLRLRLRLRASDMTLTSPFPSLPFLSISKVLSRHPVFLRYDLLACLPCLSALLVLREEGLILFSLERGGWDVCLFAVAVAGRTRMRIR